MSMISDNLARIRERIEKAAVSAQTPPESIRLIAVSKTKPIELIEEAISAGLTDFGENRVQETVEKYDVIGDRVRWHLIGHLQTNKAKHAARVCHMIQSVDNLALGQELDRRLRPLKRVLPVLVQVKTSKEETKSGVEPDRASELVEQLAGLSSLSLQGLMTIPAYTPDPEEARPSFQLLRALKDQISDLRIPGVDLRYLSMGMTHDFEIAIQEGANMVRVGTALFGARDAL